MAGGQERILRGRIRSVQATKKITRAMELIAASRIVKAQQRVARGRALQRADHRGGPATSPPPAASVAAPAARRPRRDRARPCLRGDRRRPRPVRRLQRRRPCAPPRARSRPTSLARRGLPHRRRRPQGRELLPVPRLQASTRVVHRLHRDTRPTRTPARSASTSSSCYLAGEVDRVELVYTRFVSAGSQEVVLRPLVPLERRDASRAATARPATATAPSADYEFEPEPGDDPRGAAAALRRGPHLRRPAQRRGVASRRPPAGDEGGHRQRRGADQEPQPRS